MITRRFLLIFSHQSIRTAFLYDFNGFAKVFFGFDFGPLRCEISAPVTLSAGPLAVGILPGDFNRHQCDIIFGDNVFTKTVHGIDNS